MEKKVGILSMQRIQNYGSFLQAYGLMSILKELGAQVEFVDYHPGKCLIKPKNSGKVARKLEKVLDVFKIHAPLMEKLNFIKYKKNYATNYYPYLGIEKDTMNYAPSLDLLIIGSDEVFNCIQDNTNIGYTKELFGEGNNAKRLISYAASCGNTTISKLVQFGIEEELSQLLDKFDAISVRDDNTRKVVGKLTDKDIQTNVDPVIAYDFLNKCHEIPEKINDKNYILLYGYSGRFTSDECKKIRKYADVNGLSIYCIGGIQECCDKFIDRSPFEVLAYFKHASAVITDTFHGSIMSIITHQNFAVFVRSKGYGNQEKLEDLLLRFNLEDRIVTAKHKMNEILNESIDYDSVDEIIHEERKKSYSYLRKELELA